MPNYKISDRARTDLIASALALTNRRIAHMEAGFPLVYAQVQDVILPRKWRAVLPEVAASGVGIQSAMHVQVKCAGAAYARAAIVQLHCTKELIGANWFTPMDLHLDALSENETEALANWVGIAIRERRQANFIMRLITEFLRDYAPTTAHVQMRWPELSVLFDHMGVAGGWIYGRRKEIQDGWKTKMQERSTRSKPYRWDEKSADWEVRSRRGRELASGVLAGALILPKTVEDNAEVTASVYKWTPLPTDPDK